MSNKNELTDVEKLIAEFEASDLRELQVRHGDFEIYLSKDADAAGLSSGDTISAGPSASSVPKKDREAVAKASEADVAPAAAPQGVPDDLPDDAVLVRAPYLDTFYRSPKPGAAPYVEVGQDVSDDTELCLVEVMKLFTSVRAGMVGKVHAVLAEDGAMVQADQPLFVVVPA